MRAFGQLDPAVQVLGRRLSEIGQNSPAVQSPLQLESSKPGMLPYVPLGHGVLELLPSGQYVVGPHSVQTAPPPGEAVPGAQFEQPVHPSQVVTEGCIEIKSESK